MLIWLVPSPCHWEGSKKFYLSSPRKPRLQSQFLYCQMHKVALKIIFKISTILQLKILDQTLPQNLDINSVPTSRQHFSFIVWTTNLLQNLEKTPPLMYWHISRLNSLPNIRLKYRPSCRQNIPYHQHQETSSRKRRPHNKRLCCSCLVCDLWHIFELAQEIDRVVCWENTSFFLQHTAKPALNLTEGGLEYQP